MEASGIGMTNSKFWKKKNHKLRILYPGRPSFKTEYYSAIFKKEQTTDTCNDLGVSPVNYAEWKKEANRRGLCIVWFYLYNIVKTKT